MRLIDADALKQNMLITTAGTGYQSMVLAEIDNAPTVDAEQTEAKWIPCSERLPEKDGWHLVTVQGYETVTDVSLYSADGSAWGDVSTKQKVTAWKPLPKPYREDDEA